MTRRTGSSGVPARLTRHGRCDLGEAMLGQSVEGGEPRSKGVLVRAAQADRAPAGAHDEIAVLRSHDRSQIRRPWHSRGRSRPRCRRAPGRSGASSRLPPASSLSSTCSICGRGPSSAANMQPPIGLPAPGPVSSSHRSGASASPPHPPRLPSPHQPLRQERPDDLAQPVRRLAQPVEQRHVRQKRDPPHLRPRRVPRAATGRTPVTERQAQQARRALHPAPTHQRAALPRRRVQIHDLPEAAPTTRKTLHRRFVWTSYPISINSRLPRQRFMLAPMGTPPLPRGSGRFPPRERLYQMMRDRHREGRLQPIADASPGSISRTSSRSNQRQSSSSAASRSTSVDSASAWQPIISDEGNGQAWLE